MSGRANFNAPISDTMALRVAVHESHDGYVDFQNPTRYTVAAAGSWLSGGRWKRWRTSSPSTTTCLPRAAPRHNAQNQTAARVRFAGQLSSKNLSWNVSYEKFADRYPSMDLMQIARAGQKLVGP